MRRGPARGGSQLVPVLRREAAPGRARKVREGQGSRHTLRGRDAERCRRSASDRSKRRDRARREAGLCTRCGKQQPVKGRTVCEPCRQARGEREREQYAARRAAGECGKCGAPRPRWQRALRTVRRERGQTLKEEGEERPRPPALRPAPGARALHRLRRTVPGRGPVPGVRPPLVPALGRASRPADPAASLHGHRDRDGR